MSKDPDMKTILIVGASRGLGLGLVAEHLKRGFDVIATVRKAADEADLKALPVRSASPCTTSTSPRTKTSPGWPRICPPTSTSSSSMRAFQDLAASSPPQTTS